MPENKSGQKKSRNNNKINRIGATDRKDQPLVAALILFLIATFVTFALAGANELTKGTIAAQAKIDQDNARIEVFPGAISFEDLSTEFITAQTPEIHSLFKVLDGDGKMSGLVAVSAARGYSGDVEIMAGISLDGKLTGIKVISDNETPGLGKKVRDKPFTNRFINKKPGLLFSLKKEDSNANLVDSVTGATISSTAMVNAANAALRISAIAYARLPQGGGTK